MANTNTTTYVVDQLFARSLMALRQFAVTPRYVNRGYDPSPGAKLSTVAIPIPAAVGASAVTPSYVPPDDSGISPTQVVITLDKWYEAAFFLTDKENEEVVADFWTAQLGEAVKGLVNQVDDDVLALYKAVYGFDGTPAQTPFASDLSELASARKRLARQLAPTNDRVFLMDPSAEANLVGLRTVVDASLRPGGGAAALNEGEVGRLLGFMTAVNQNIPTHTTGDATGFSASGTNAAGQSAVTVTGGTGVFVAGDIIEFSDEDPDSGDGSVNGYYTVLTNTGSPNATAITVSPNLRTAKSSSETITKQATHVVNLAFQRNAFALAARPLAASDPFNLANAMRRSIMDPISGLSLAMEVSRQHYRTRLALSSLYGVQCVRPQLATRVAS